AVGVVLEGQGLIGRHAPIIARSAGYVCASRRDDSPAAPRQAGPTVLRPSRRRIRLVASLPPVFVVGAGAIGLYMAAHLSQVAAVTLVARGPRADALEAEGFELAGADTGTYRLPVLTLEAGLVIPPDAIVIVATKAT